MPSTQTVTNINQTQLPPWLSGAMTNNIGMANWLTSGILPSAANLNTPGLSIAAGGNADFDPMNGFSFGSGGPLYAPEAAMLNADGTPAIPPSTFTAGFTPDQTAAFGGIRNMGSTAPTAAQLGAGTYTGLANFQAPNVNPAQMTAATMAPVNPMQAAQIARVDPIAAQRFTDINLQGYFNPYRQNVMDPVLADLDASAERTRAQEAMNARAAGTMRGSGFQVGRGITEGELARARGATTGQLYDRMFGQAAGLASADITNALNADTFNANLAQQRNISQAGLDQNASTANMDAALRTGMFNTGNAQQAGLANAQFTQGANLANQGAAISSAGVQATGAQGLGLANQGAWNNQNLATDALLRSGGVQQDQAQRQIMDPWTALQMRQSMVTGAAPQFTGSTSTTTGPGQSGGGAAGGLGGAAAGAGIGMALGLSNPWTAGLMGLGAVLGLL